MRTNDKIALVTGATRGIGLETVRQLAQAGRRTVLAGREGGKAEQAAQQLQADGLPVDAIALDVTDPADITAAAEEVARRCGRLDILINNAGIALDDLASKPSKQTLQTWRETFDTTLLGVVAVTQESSILGSLTPTRDRSSPNYNFKVPAYNASKSALNAWTVHLAYELRDTPVTVNAVHPGNVKTHMNRGEGELDVAEGARSSIEMALRNASTSGDSMPNGSFIHLGETLPW